MEVVNEPSPDENTVMDSWTCDQSFLLQRIKQILQCIRGLMQKNDWHPQDHFDHVLEYPHSVETSAKEHCDIHRWCEVLWHRVWWHDQF